MEIAILVLVIMVFAWSVFKERSRLALKDIQEESDRITARQRKERAAETLAASRIRDRIADLIAPHLQTLRKKRDQSLYRDEYGKVAGLDKWVREVKYFRDKVLLPDSALLEILRSLDSGETVSLAVRPLTDEGTDLLIEFIDITIDTSSLEPEACANIDTMSGSDYELYCADVLESKGWSVVRKGGSGDQGVDLVARLGNLSVAIQCKRYSQPVGNKAIQEVNAGRQFEQCDLAVVVSNAEFTPAARQLANALGVILIHHDDLWGLHDHMDQHFPALISGEASA